MIDTSVPPLANASSNPSVFNVAQNARYLGYAPAVDLEPLAPVENYLNYIAKKENMPIGTPAEYDYSQYVHQVPGGMISNLRFQLNNIGMLDRLEEVLEEAVQVRADLGYPIMVTPFSQFVGSQAAINVIKGERYAQVTDQVIQYAAGLWGEEAASEVAADVKDKILARPRAKEYANWRLSQISLKELRERLGGPSVRDDELLMRYVAGHEDVDAMLRAGPPKRYLDARTPLIGLLTQLSRQEDCNSIYIRKGGISLILKKLPSSTPAKPPESDGA